MLGVMNAIAHAPAPPARGPKLDNRRVLAGVVDLVIVALGAAVVLFAGDAATGDASDVQGALGAVALGWALYYFFALESGDGQTVGKKLMKLRVVRQDGSPAGMREVAVRTILRVVDNYLVGLIVMLATGERRQRIGDLAAGTIVVDASRPASAAPAPVPADEAVELDEGEEAEPVVAEIATISLPARPAPPSTVADLAAPAAPAATEVPELRPFPPVDEPVMEEPAPVEVEAPVVELEPVTDDVLAGEELSEIASTSIQELAGDVAAAQVEPLDAEPVAVEAVDEPSEPGEAPISVRSVETVSAIDLIMGGAAEDEGSDESPQDTEGAASA
jgi:uncharacterized RDD family membrane protein YckC